MKINEIKSLEEMNDAVKENKNVLTAIKLKCMDCCCYQWNEVRECNSTGCPLWVFRLGKNPFRKREISQEERDKMSERMKLLRDSILSKNSKV